MILNLKEPKNSTPPKKIKPLRSDEHFQQSSQMQNQRETSVAFLYISNKQTEKEIM
jgi:hypothetical protein